MKFPTLKNHWRYKTQQRHLQSFFFIHRNHLEVICNLQSAFPYVTEVFHSGPSPAHMGHFWSIFLLCPSLCLCSPYHVTLATRQYLQAPPAMLPVPFVTLSSTSIVLDWTLGLHLCLWNGVVLRANARATSLCSCRSVLEVTESRRSQVVQPPQVYPKQHLQLQLHQGAPWGIYPE